MRQIGSSIDSATVTLAATGQEPGVAATSDGQDRILNQGEVSFAHNRNGVRNARTDNNGTTSYRTDAHGRLRGVTLADGRTITYLLDGPEG